MSIIITSGYPGPALQAAGELLHGAGVARAQAARNNTDLTVHTWLERIMASRSGRLEAIAEPGRAWEQILGEIFVANWDQACWGWRDARSTWLLDFFKAYESQFRFLLLFQSSQSALQHALQAGEAASPEVAVQDWLAYSREQLRFYNRNAGRCLLIDAQALNQPAGLLALCAEKFEADIAADAGSVASLVEAGSPLAAYLAADLVSAFPEAQDLYLEMQASGNKFDAEGASAPAAQVRIALLADALHELGDLRAQQAELTRLETEKSSLSASLQVLEQQVQSLEADNASVRNGTQALQEASAESRKENDLLLIQLHQVQEELEAQFLKAQQAEKEQSARAGQLDQLTRERAALQKTAADLQARLKPLEEERARLADAQAALQKHNDELKTATAKSASAADQGAAQKLKALEEERARLQAARDQLQQQLTQAQDELKAEKKRHDELKAAAAKSASAADQGAAQKLKSLEDERARLQAAPDQLQQQLTQAQGQLKVEKERAEKAGAEWQQAREEGGRQAAAHKELQQENELMLLQLHQVQEELENYFLKHQELKQQAEAQDARWKRLLVRWPQYCDWESVEVRQAPQADSPQDLEWRFTGFVHGGRSIPLLIVRTVVRDRPGLLIVREGGAADQPLLRWPPGQENTRSVFLAPASLAQGQRARHEQVLNLASSDWALLQVLTVSLGQLLRTGQFTRAPSCKPDVAFWRDALQGLQRDFAAMRAAFRYDKVELVREQVNPEYEHLALRFSEVTIGAQRWSSFEYRLSAADVGKEPFGSSPKMEFPLQQGNIKPLENWYEESRDDFGHKTELRFKPSTRAMDLNVWKRLSAADQKLVTSLAGRMPYVLALMEHQGISLSRSWDDWKLLMAGVIAVLREHVSAGSRPPAQGESGKPVALPAVAPASADIVPLAHRKKRATSAGRRGTKPG